MGGSKVSTKIGIIENLMDKVDNLILCGGMAFTFAKAQGGKIGNSLVEDDKLQLALDIIEKAKAKGVNLVLGSDCVAADTFANDANTQVVRRQVTFLTDGWVWMQVLRLAKHSLLLLKMPRLSCGTVLPVYSKWITSLVVLMQSQKQSQKQLRTVLSH